MAEGIAASYIDYIKERLAVTSDDDLAKEVGVAKSTIASWRRRSSIPYSFYGRMNEERNIDYFHFYDKFITEALANSTAGEKLLVNAAMSLAKDIDTADLSDWASWIVDNRVRIFSNVVRADSGNVIEVSIDEGSANSTIMSLMMRYAGNPAATAAIIRSTRMQA